MKVACCCEKASSLRARVSVWAKQSRFFLAQQNLDCFAQTLTRARNDEAFSQQRPSSQRQVLAAIFMLILTSFFNITHADNLSTLSIEQLKRFQALTKEIRCVVCQNQTIADSSAPLANDLREKVYKMVNEKKSNEEIKDYLVKRYGEFILMQPRFNKLTFILWAFPFIGLACLLLFLIRFIKNQKTANTL